MRVLVATAMYPTPERPYFGTFVRSQVESLRAAGVDAEPFVLQGPSRKVMYATAAARLRQVVAREPVDLVHAHYSYVGLVARLQRRVPVVLTFHGDDLLGTVDERGRTEPWSRAVAAGGAALARTVDAVIVQTPAMAERLVGVRRVRVIPHEVDLDRFRPVPKEDARQRLGLAPRPRYVLFAASPDIPVKRFPLAREAFELLRSRDPSVELLVVHREPQERLALYFNACDALVFTSFQEGSPNVVKQAMACNLPVVATDVGDVRSVVGGTLGCSIVPAAAPAVAAGIQYALRFGGRTDGRTRVAHLRPEVVAGQVIALYQEVLSGAGLPRSPSEVD